MRYDRELRLLVLKASRRILAATPARNFLPPSYVGVVTAEEVRQFAASDWFEVSWSGDAPRGFTAQTCYLFKWTYEGGIAEVSTAGRHEPVVL